MVSIHINGFMVDTESSIDVNGFHIAKNSFLNFFLNMPGKSSQSQYESVISQLATFRA